MPDQKITDLPQTIALDPADLIEICDDPAGSPISQKSTVQAVWDAINLLVASGALTLSDVLPLFTGAAAEKGTVQKILDAMQDLAASSGTFAAGDKLLMHDSAAVAADYDDLESALWNQSVSSTGWVDRSIRIRTGATLDSLGETFASVTGTVAASAVAADQPQGSNNVTSSSINNYAQNHSANLRWTLVNQLRHTFNFRLVDITDVRWYLGLFSTTVHRNSADSANQQWTDGNIGTTASGIGIRFSTSAGDANFQLVDSNAGTVTVTDTGVAAANVIKQVSFRLRSNGTQIDVYMNGTKVIDGYTFSCPTNALLKVTAGNTNLAAVAKNYRYFGFHTAQKFY